MKIEEIKTLVINQFNILGKKQNIDFNTILKNKELEELFIKNCEITDYIIDIINKLEKLKRLVFINCKFNITLSLPKTESLRLENCKNINKCTFNKNITKLYIENCDRINIKNIRYLHLQSLKIENTLTENLGQISTFIDLEYLYLNEMYLKERIDYSKLQKLKKVNLNGSYVDNKEEYLKQFKGTELEVNYLEKNLKIG